MVRQIQARTLLSSIRPPDPWFGLRYNMNLYRGCQHQCIYCDSRSDCYGIDDFSDIQVKTNALELLRQIARVYAAVTFTITTADDELARQVEPAAFGLTMRDGQRQHFYAETDCRRLALAPHIPTWAGDAAAQLGLFDQ